MGLEAPARHARLATTPPRIARNSPPGMKPTEYKAPCAGRFCFRQNRSLFESNVQAACKHTTCCTRQQAQTVNGLRLTPNSLKRRTLLPSAAQTPLPRMNRGGSAYHKPTFRSRPHVADGQISAPNSPSVSACAAIHAYNRRRAARSHFKPVCARSRELLPYDEQQGYKRHLKRFQRIVLRSRRTASAGPACRCLFQIFRAQNICE